MDAETIALVAINARSTGRIVEGGLEIEHGCLVYPFDIRVPGRPGIEEVIVDAGNGSVLARP